MATLTLNRRRRPTAEAAPQPRQPARRRVVRGALSNPNGSSRRAPNYAAAQATIVMAADFERLPGQQRFESAVYRAGDTGSRLPTTYEGVRALRAVYAYATHLDNAEKARVGTTRTQFSVDHIRPVSHGGATTADNLQIVRRVDDEAKGDRGSVTLKAYEVPEEFVNKYFGGK